MMKDNNRVCDVCDSVIPKGETYRVSTVPKRNAELFRSTMERVPSDLVPTASVDSKGNIRLDICLDCHLNMGLEGTELVN